MTNRYKELAVMHDVFFSVSNVNEHFARATYKSFPADLIYLYSQTGREGVHINDEIEIGELSTAKFAVVFWSRAYPLSPGCVKEILIIADRYRAGGLVPIIIRIDDYPIKWQPDLDPAIKPVFDALLSLLDYRAAPEHSTVDHARELIGRVIDRVLQGNHPRMARNDLESALRKILKKDSFTFYPACWVSGFNGVGRRSLVNALCSRFAPNGRVIEIDVDETTLPGQMLLRIQSEAFNFDLARLRQSAVSQRTIDAAAVAAAIEQLAVEEGTLVLRHHRVVEESVALPEWLDDVAHALRPSRRPKLFIISQLPLMSERLLVCREFMVPFRVPTMVEHELLDFCHELVAYYDPHPQRWGDKEIERIANATGGNIGFLIAIVRQAASMENFDSIDGMLADEGARMADMMSTYVHWAFCRLQDRPDEQKMMLFLNDISPCHITDLDRAIKPTGSVVRVLGRLIELGLVERQADDLYRLTPLLGNRLNRHLVKPELIRWVRDAQIEFARASIAAGANDPMSEHEFIRLETRIQASLLSDDENPPEELREFLAASNWFQAGIRLYHARRRDSAYRLLKRAYRARDQFRDLSRTEIDRYFCLAAIRKEEFHEAEACIARLNSDIRKRPIATFLQANLHERRREFPNAIKEYEKALELNTGKDTRLEHIYRPLIRCILASYNPDFKKAARLAETYVGRHRTVFSLSSRARVYLRWKYEKSNVRLTPPPDIDQLYLTALRELEENPGVGAAAFELYAREAEYNGEFPVALERMSDAVEADPARFELRAERWRIMARSGERNSCAQVISELNDAKSKDLYAADWSFYIEALAETYLRALDSTGQPHALVNGFAPELQQGGKLARIIARHPRPAH